MKILIFCAILLAIWGIARASGWQPDDPEPTCHGYNAGGPAVICQDSSGNYVDP